MVLKFILKIGLGSIAIWIAILWYFWDSFENFITSYLTWIPWEWAQDTIAYVAAPFAGYTLIMITISTLTSFYSEKLLIDLGKKHYPEQPAIASPSILGSIILMIQSTLLFLFLLILLSPLLFIPLLGQVLMLYLWSILLKSPTVHDVGGLFINDRKKLKEKQKKSTIIAMIASLFNYIPLLNIFAPVFAQIMFLHHILGKNHK
jgi:uncharacterized protein involved in cysteine biosynthesis